MNYGIDEKKWRQDDALRLTQPSEGGATFDPSPNHIDRMKAVSEGLKAAGKRIDQSGRLSGARVPPETVEEWAKRLANEMCHPKAWPQTEGE